MLVFLKLILLDFLLNSDSPAQSKLCSEVLVNQAC
jgi:hypothetical protein